ncbi:hypothetical protein EX30DRAFT_368889 [Ascodesmis nigricans]|uniref:Uncharacterized protein n=1 Tax=Ascodesmis nigricans TaxID=341454 RepID=A0A4S2N325_9PEZI|nr:hypothetical protein EX30DRAFT_368889 [Ascodesmis nigricans]
MALTRPPHTRTSSSYANALEFPSLSASSLSTPSIADDQDPININIDLGGTDMVDNSNLDMKEMRGRSPTVDPAKYDDMDPRNMSPRRNHDELAQLSAETKARLEEQAKSLQSGLLALLERVERIREEHDKLEGENRFLQEYIGSLMATSRIAGSAPGNRNSSGRLR